MRQSRSGVPVDCMYWILYCSLVCLRCNTVLCYVCRLKVSGVERTGVTLAGVRMRARRKKGGRKQSGVQMGPCRGNGSLHGLFLGRDEQQAKAVR